MRGNWTVSSFPSAWTSGLADKSFKNIRQGLDAKSLLGQKKVWGEECVSFGKSLRMVSWETPKAHQMRFSR